MNISNTIYYLYNVKKIMNNILILQFIVSFLIIVEGSYFFQM